MTLHIVTDDPLRVLTSTKPVVENARFVTINSQKIPGLATLIERKIAQGLEDTGTHFGVTGNLVDDVQLILIEDAVNFCFWAEPGQARWQVEWPPGQGAAGGWYGLKSCFARALADGVPILDARYLAGLTLDDVSQLFRSANRTQIPLLEQRLENLRETGSALLEQYGGQFVHALEDSGHDAVGLVELIRRHFPSFRDMATWHGTPVYFLKRAQICAGDISLLMEEALGRPLHNVQALTAFADYKLPQMLRMFGVIEYSQDLADRVDNCVLIPAGSREEIEIRAATIWSVEFIRQVLGKYPASKIDFALWLLSQSPAEDTRPYHRTYSIYY